MTSVRELHQAAMRLSDEAESFGQDAARQRELREAATRGERLALETFLLSPKHRSEPTRSVLARSLAALALRCDDLATAEWACHVGLAGDPDDFIADQLRSMMGRASFHRHLEVRGQKLSPSTIGCSMYGRFAEAGFAPLDEVYRRLRQTDRFIARGAEELEGYEFNKNRSEPPAIVRKKYESFLSAATNSSYGFVIRLAHPSNEAFEFEDDPPARLAARVTELLQAFQASGPDGLAPVVQDDAYRRFYATAIRDLLPDGDAVQQVTFSANVHGEHKTIPLTQTRSHYLPKVEPAPDGPTSSTTTRSDIPTTLRGVLKMGDADEGKVRITHDGGKPLVLTIEAGLDEAVRNYFDREVTVVWEKRGRLKYLVDIG